MKIVKLTAAVISALVVGQASAAGTAVFAGASVNEDSKFGHLGGVMALNGDLAKDGILVRGMLSYGTYNYDTTAVLGGNVDGDATGIEVGVGYQWVTAASRFSLYGGIDHQDHDLSPNDTTNSVRGGETGAAVQAEYETLGAPWYGGLIAKYSTAYDTYWVRGRVGYNFGSINVGPELVLGGNDEYDETRYGLYLNMPVSKSTALSLSAGYRKADGDGSRDDQTGGYAGIAVTTTF